MTKAVSCDVFFSCIQRKISNETVMMLENHIQTEIWKKIGLGSIKSKGFDVKKNHRKLCEITKTQERTVQD